MTMTNSRLGWHFEPHHYWPFVPMHNDLLHQVVVAKYYLYAKKQTKSGIKMWILHKLNAKWQLDSNMHIQAKI